jgi:hypothetical protein
MGRRKRSTPKSERSKHSGRSRRPKGHQEPGRSDAPYQAGTTSSSPPQRNNHSTEHQIRSLVEIARNTERHRDSNQHHRRNHEAGLTFVLGGVLCDSRRESGDPQDAARDENDDIDGRRVVARPARTEHFKSPSQDDGCYTPHLPIPHQPRPQDCSEKEPTRGREDDEPADLVVFKGRRSAATRSKIDQSHHVPVGPRESTSTRQRYHEPVRVEHGQRSNLSTSIGVPARRRKGRRDEGRGFNSTRYDNLPTRPKSSALTFSSSDDEALADYIANLKAHDNHSDICSLDEAGPEVVSESSSDVELQMKRNPQIPHPIEREPTQRPPAPSVSTNVGVLESPELDGASTVSADTVDQAARDLQNVLDGLNEEGERSQPESPGREAEIDMPSHTDIDWASNLTDAAVIEVDPRNMESDEVEDIVRMHQSVNGGVLNYQERKLRHHHEPALTRELEFQVNGGFDITDRSRKSIQGGSRTKNLKVDLQLSDSELEHALLASWEADRGKKKQRKRERAERRARTGTEEHANFMANFAMHSDFDWNDLKERIMDFVASDEAR